MIRRFLLAAVVVTAGCSSEQEGVRVSQFYDGGMDCSKRFTELVKEIEDYPGALKWGSEEEPTRLVQHIGKEGMFLITGPKHPSHPAIIYRAPLVSTEHVGMVTDACAYGDRKALDEDLRAYAKMDQALATEFSCGLCSDRQRSSPALGRNGIAWLADNPPPSLD